MIYSLSPEQLARFSTTLWPLLKRGCRGGGADPTEMLKMGLRGDAMFWVAFDEEIKGLIVTEINKWPEGKVVRILCLAGTAMKTWLDDWHVAAHAHGRANDCIKIVTEGRRGWERVLKMKPVRYVYEKDIEA